MRHQETTRPILKNSKRQYFLDNEVPPQYRNEVAKKTRDSDWRRESHSLDGFRDDYWVEFTENGEPGSSDYYPCLVFCVRCSLPECSTAKTYEPLTGWC